MFSSFVFIVYDGSVPFFNPSSSVLRIEELINLEGTDEEKRLSRKISYEDYIEWKINCIVEENLSIEKNNRN